MKVSILVRRVVALSVVATLSAAGTASAQPTAGPLMERWTAPIGTSTGNNQFGLAVSAGGIRTPVFAPLDKIADFAVGSPQENGGQGAVYIASGLDGGGLPRTGPTPPPAAQAITAALSPIPPPTGVGSRFGNSVLMIDDLDGDGSQEFIVGVPENTGTWSGAGRAPTGRIMVFSSNTPGVPAVYRGEWINPSAALNDEYGTSLAYIGGSPGPGGSSIIAIGATRGGRLTGNGYVEFLSITEVAGGAQFTSLNRVDSALVGDRFGQTLATAFDGLGNPMGIIIGAPNTNSANGNRSGRVYFYDISHFFGSSTVPFATFDGFNSSDFLGRSVASCASCLPITGTSPVIKLLAGAPLANVSSQDEGAVYTLQLDNFGDTALNLVRTTFTGSQAGEQSGFSIDETRDRNGDNQDDIVVGSPGFSLTATSSDGQFSLVSGQTSAPFFNITSSIVGANFGVNVKNVAPIRAAPYPWDSFGIAAARLVGSAGSGGALSMYSAGFQSITPGGSFPIGQGCNVRCVAPNCFTRATLTTDRQIGGLSQTFTMSNLNPGFVYLLLSMPVAVTPITFNPSGCAANLDIGSIVYTSPPMPVPASGTVTFTWNVPAQTSTGGSVTGIQIMAQAVSFTQGPPLPDLNSLQTTNGLLMSYQ